MKKNRRNKKSDKYNNKQRKPKHLSEWSNIIGVGIAFISMIISLKTLDITQEIGYTANKISEQSNLPSIYIRKNSENNIDVINSGGKMNNPEFNGVDTILIFRIVDENKNDLGLCKIINLEDVYELSQNNEEIGNGIIYKLNNKYLNFNRLESKLKDKLKNGRYKNCNINLNFGMNVSIKYIDFQKNYSQYNGQIYLNEFIPNGAFKEYLASIKITGNEEEDIKNLVKIIEQ